MTESWLSFTAGPEADLLTPAQMASGAKDAVALGAGAVLVNCVPARMTLDYVQALLEVVGDQVPVGAYANAGSADERMGWTSDPGAPEAYAQTAARWAEAGARLLGGCCGTGPAHVAALRSVL